MTQRELQILISPAFSTFLRERMIEDKFLSYTLSYINSRPEERAEPLIHRLQSNHCGIISSAFTWSSTHEGGDYWSNLSRQWGEILLNMKGKKHRAPNLLTNEL